jgi:hypothetical protein
VSPRFDIRTYNWPPCALDPANIPRLQHGIPLGNDPLTNGNAGDDCYDDFVDDLNLLGTSGSSQTPLLFTAAQPGTSDADVADRKVVRQLYANDDSCYQALDARRKLIELSGAMDTLERGDVITGGIVSGHTSHSAAKQPSGSGVLHEEICREQNEESVSKSKLRESIRRHWTDCNDAGKQAAICDPALEVSEPVTMTDTRNYFRNARGVSYGNRECETDCGNATISEQPCEKLKRKQNDVLVDSEVIDLTNSDCQVEIIEDCSWLSKRNRRIKRQRLIFKL